MHYVRFRKRSWKESEAAFKADDVFLCYFADVLENKLSSRNKTWSFLSRCDELVEPSCTDVAKAGDKAKKYFSLIWTLKKLVLVKCLL